MVGSSPLLLNGLRASIRVVMTPSVDLRSSWGRPINTDPMHLIFTYRIIPAKFNRKPLDDVLYSRLECELFNCAPRQEFRRRTSRSLRCLAVRFAFFPVPFLTGPSWGKVAGVGGLQLLVWKVSSSVSIRSKNHEVYTVALLPLAAEGTSVSG